MRNTYAWIVQFNDGHSEVALSAMAARKLAEDYVNEAYAGESDNTEVREVLSEIQTKYMERRWSVDPFVRVERKIPYGDEI